MRQTTSGILVALGALLLIVLSLEWHRGTTVHIAGVVHAHGGSSGWSGWGSLAGAAVICLVILELLELTAETAPRTGQVLFWVPLLGLITLVATVAAFVDHSATVWMGGMMAVTDVSRDWPAYAGLVLAALIAIVALWRVIAETRVEHVPKGLTA
jgi:TRAP-type C4-dicarboxylate transport system permease small subunit